MHEVITEENWPRILKSVHTQMAEHVRPYLTPISKSAPSDSESGSPHGSGTVVEVKRRHYLLTCEHVVKLAFEAGYRLAYLPREGDFYRALLHEWFYEPAPVDLAITLVDSAAWSEPDRMALPAGRIATTHDVAPNEVLMLCGYPVAESHFSRFTGEPTIHGCLIPYSARETSLPTQKGYDPSIHCARDYPQ